MPILVSCPCGWGTRVQDDLAGKRSKCPKCQAPVVVPRPEAALPDVDDVKLVDDSPPVRVSDKPQPAAPAQPSASQVDEPDLVEDLEVVEEPRRPTKPAARRGAVAAAADDDVVVDGVEVDETPRRAPAKTPKPSAAEEAIELELDDVQPGSKKRRPAEDDDEAAEPAPRRRKTKKRRPVVDDEPRRPFIAISAGVASGFLLLLSGVVWLGIAIANDRFNPRALVAVLIGLIMLARGFLGLEED